ncbi:Annexin [Penicillium fimorum]|uniref:Annexin n=1 Tax=Penicillium fimorum TaxID=1882269 RepID=A0A9W9Y4F7_9EURO|nr:Annexin [Penicillium fimorum]
MSLQVNDPRSRTRSKSPGRERSRSRDSRAPSPSHRSRSPAVEAPRTKGYNPDEEAEIERQYKLISAERRRENDEPRIASRAPRSSRYDVDRSDSDSESRRRDAERSQRRRDDRYEHSDSERGSAAAAPSRSHRRRPSPDRGSRVNHDSDSADDLAYGDAPGSHPSYARPNRYSYAQPTQLGAAAPIDWASVPECERPGYVPPSSQPTGTASMPGAFPVASTYPATSGSVPAPVIPSQYPGFPGQAYATSAGYAPAHYRTASATDAGYPAAAGYANPGPYQYAQVDPNVVKYASKAEPKQAPVYPASTNEHYSRPLPQQLQNQYYPQSQPQPQQAPDQSHRYKPKPEFVEIAPGGNRSSTRPHSQSVSSNTLAVAGASAAHSPLPPGSPLLEPYRGTYQSISPMPSPIVIPSIRDDDISDLEPLDGSDSSRRSKHHRSHSSVGEKESRSRSSKDKKDKERDDRTDKRLTRPAHDRHDSLSSIPDGKIIVSPTTGRKRVSFYDAGPDAAAMQSALNHARNIDSKPIIQILPRLSSDEIILLRTEYKSRVRMQGKGINLAKHLRLKLGSSSFGKVCYATALGRWESEAYWANCYYQAGTSRRELLIESLMGRSNAAIREIKNSFRDTRYDNSIERCMRSELRADKFRVAILLALEGQRQDDREPLDKRLVRDDVQDLHRAIVREGGETAMIHIIVMRSDSHLREVLRAYEDNYGHNFTRAMISKSRNLVGETLAHILNGAINRPMRDALLLHQALRESRTGRERSELLISRLVRLHWEPRHLDLVKNEYRRRYHERLEEAIAEEILSLNGGQDWGEFCIELARNA